MIPSDDRKRFQRKLINWWEKNKRDFPWRNTKDPYHVLIAEILLHRTKAKQVVPVYNKFLEMFPSIKDIANASESEVKEVIYSLGLSWRAELLYRMAVELTQRNIYRVPPERAELESLPGVSHYIASAVRCFAFGFPEVLLDTNTVRIVGRIFGEKVTDSSRRSRKFRDLLGVLEDERHPREFNSAMIDLGALICRPSNPQCDKCPVERICDYANNREVI